MTSESISSSDFNGLTVSYLDPDDPYGTPILHLQLADNVTTSQLVEWITQHDELQQAQASSRPVEVRVEGGTLSPRKVRRALKPYLGEVSVRMVPPPEKF